MNKIQVLTGYGSLELIFDEPSLTLYNQHKWSVIKDGSTYYIRRHVNMGKNKYKKNIFHRELLNITDSKILIDHINGNGLDNRIENLRICTPQQNNQNRRKTVGISKYKGVSFDKRRNKWTAQIMINKRGKFLGYFSNEIDAAQAYNNAATNLFGEFAKINKI